jgi:hypothetical protein
MATEATQSDKGIGLGLVLSVISLLGAAVMFGGPGQELKAWGFGGAIVAAGLAIVFLHLFE